MLVTEWMLSKVLIAINTFLSGHKWPLFLQPQYGNASPLEIETFHSRAHCSCFLGCEQFSACQTLEDCYTYL